MKITQIMNPDSRSEICNSVLRGLPRWFGIESAILEYVKDVQSMETLAAYNKDQLLGFISFKKHFSTSAEVHIMGVFEKFHRQGVGRQLLEAAEAELRKSNVKFLTVKTLSESRPNEEYAQTRNFYLKAGFVPLEEFKTLWGEVNPCLLLIKELEELAPG